MDGNPLASWRDASLILLSLEAFVLLLIPLAVMFLFNKAASWARENTWLGFRWLADKVYMVERLVGNICARIAAPIVAANRLGGRIAALGKKLVGFIQAQPR